MSPKGWECPKCGSVYAPWVFACHKCAARPVAFPTTGAPNHADTRKYAQTAPRDYLRRMR